MTSLLRLQKMITDHKPDGIATRVKYDTDLFAAVNMWSASVECKSLIEKIYCFANQVANIPKCLCGQSVRFVSITQGYREFCSRSCTHAKAAATERRVVTLKARGGVGLANPQSKLKAQRTLERVHGVSNAFCLPQAVEKRTANNPMHDPAIVESIRQKCLKDHGVDWHSKRSDVIAARIQATLDKYGVKNSAQRNYTSHTVETLQDPTKLKTMFDTSNIQTMSQQLGVCDTTVLKYLNLYGIRSPTEIAPELQLNAWLRSLGFDDFHKSRTVLTNKQEIDLYSPSQNVGIEYCGLYWHSQAHKHRSYHRNKYLACDSQNIKLITIFEDEWLNKQSTVKCRLAHLLSAHVCSVGARKLQVSMIDKKQAACFLNSHHIGGHVPASVCVGAHDQHNKLVAVMTFSKGRRFVKPKYDWEWEMIRFSTDGAHYPGLASKLFTCFVREHRPSSILSYADLRWGQGQYLSKLGFTRMDDSAPNYWYFSLTNADFKRYHRFTFNKQELLKKMPNLDNTLTEYELAKSMGLERIWDCGNATWIWRSTHGFETKTS
jgi:hypothetical protein